MNAKGAKRKKLSTANTFENVSLSLDNPAACDTKNPDNDIGCGDDDKNETKW